MAETDAEFLEKLMATFRIEAAEHVAAMTSLLLELEGGLSPERTAEAVEILFREAHSLKGAARSVNLSAVENVCQALESVLARLKRREIEAQQPLILDLLHRAVDALREITDGESPGGKDTGRELIRELQNTAAAGNGGGSAAPSPYPPEEPSAAPPAPLLAGETVRVAKSKLDSLLLQGESFLAVKQAAAQRVSEARVLSAAAAALEKETDAIAVALKDAAAGTWESARARLRQLLESHGRAVAEVSHSASGLVAALEHDARSAAFMVENLLDDLKGVSMLPFSSLSETMVKTVRDLARDQGKEAALTVSGGAIEMDRRILDEMREPLIHLLRNSVDHGLEPPEERREKGKGPAGAISLAARYREGKSVEIVISDDGRGIDIGSVKGAAVRLGVVSPEEAERYDDERSLSLIFRSGVSISPIITEISGRGLGLAIVRERVERLGGSVAIETAADRGTTFRMRLPLTLATFRGLLVRIEESLFMVPSSELRRSARIAKKDIRRIENRETVLIDGRILPLVSLAATLELPAGGTEADSRFVSVITLGRGDDRIAFAVDEILDEQEVLVKPLGPQLVRVRNVLAATVLATGKIVPILNVSDLIKSARGSAAPRTLPAVQEPATAVKSILVVEDSITARTLLKNILTTSGYAVKTAVDGVEALEALRAGRFDLVVSDVEMPRMNGFDLTARIRADKRLAELPVVLVTALQSSEDQERGIDAGANAYIVKSSFDQSNLLEVVGRLI